MKKLILFAVMMMFSAATPLWATTVVQMDFDNQAIKADIVIVGTLIGSETSQWHGYPCTKARVAVNEVIAGSLTGNEVELIEPGAGRFHVVGAKHLQNGEIYLLFLEKSPEGPYLLVGFNQGAHLVTVEKTTARKVVLTREPGKQAPGMTLDAARKRIRAVREQAGKTGTPK